MALDTYANLQTAVADYLNRDDIEDQIPDFITLAEAKFNRELRTPQMLTRATGTSSQQYVAQPTDFLQAFALDLVPGGTSRQSLRYIGVKEAEEVKATLLTGAAKYYAIIGPTFEIIPALTSDTDFQLLYYQQIPALSATNTTNWLLVKSPDLYLYSTCLEAEPFLDNDERIPVWATMRQSIMEGIALEAERALRPTTQLTMKRVAF